MQIEYGIHPTMLGYCLIAATPRGICALRFLEDNNADALITELQTEWQNASITQNQKNTQAFVQNLFSAALKNNIKLLVKGTPFQLKVWEALLKIPFGGVASYQTIAK